MSSVVITGGSRGIGAATAEACASAGYDVALDYRSRAEEAAAVVAACERHGVGAVAVPGDVADEGHIAELFDAAEALSPLHGVVNNAGILGPQTALADAETDRLRRTVEMPLSRVAGRPAAAR